MFWLVKLLIAMSTVQTTQNVLRGWLVMYLAINVESRHAFKVLPVAV